MSKQRDDKYRRYREEQHRRLQVESAHKVAEGVRDVQAFYDRDIHILPDVVKAQIDCVDSRGNHIGYCYTDVHHRGGSGAKGLRFCDWQTSYNDASGDGSKRAKKQIIYT